MMAVIATFAISLNLHSSNEEVVFGAPAVQMPRGGPKYCAFEAEWENCKMAATGTVCISEDGKCGTGVEVGAPGEGSGEGGSLSNLFIKYHNLSNIRLLNSYI